MLAAEQAPDTEFFRSITWVYANEIEPETLAVGGRPGGEPRFRIQVTVPEGALSDRRKGVLIDSFNQAVLRATGLPESEGLRVWTVIREVPDGNWGAAGQQVRYQQLVEAAAAEREQRGARLTRRRGLAAIAPVPPAAGRPWRATGARRRSRPRPRRPRRRRA